MSKPDLKRLAKDAIQEEAKQDHVKSEGAQVAHYLLVGSPIVQGAGPMVVVRVKVETASGAIECFEYRYDRSTESGSVWDVECE